MPDNAYTATTTAYPAIDVFAPLRGYVLQAPDFFGVVAILNSIWNTLAIIAFLISGLFIFGTIYAMQRSSQLAAEEAAKLREAERLFLEQKQGRGENSRWNDVEQHITSPNPNDWRLAIIEADIMLEEALHELGLAGTTIGEKLKGASIEQIRSLDAAWKAHRVRNDIAHIGADFVLTQKMAQDTINLYRQVFTELGKI